MSISIRCPKCSQVSPVPDAMGGSLYTCGTCGATLRVPAVAGATTPANPAPNAANPFAAPATGAAPESESVYSAYTSPPRGSDAAADVTALMSVPYIYRPASGLVLTLTVIFVLHIIFDIVIGGMEVAQLALDVEELGQIPLGDGNSLPVFDMVYGLTALLTIPLSLVTAILFLVYINRANKNARALGAVGMQFTPGWCVGWFFVPIMNLFRPYQAIREIFQASDPKSSPASWKLAHAPGLVGLWWGVWLIGNVLGQVETRLAFREDDIQASAAIGVVTSALGVILCLIAIRLVRSLHQRQETKASGNVAAV